VGLGGLGGCFVWGSGGVFVHGGWTLEFLGVWSFLGVLVGVGWCVVVGARPERLAAPGAL